MVKGAMKPKKNETDASALDLIEESVHLLRLAPSGMLAGYYFGSVPFVLGLLYFWADMSRNAFAAGYCGPSALGLALLFAWMKYRHAVFAEALFARISRTPAPRRTLTQKARITAVQTCIHSAGMIMLPIAAVITAPFAWAYAFFQNASLPPDDETYTLKSVCGQAWEQAKSRPAQNHLILSILSLFGLFVFLNTASAVYFLPRLLKSILGIETIFTMSIHTVLNSTFLTAVTCMTWLFMDPLIKALYVLRSFYGRSLKSGEDIRVELRAVAAKKSAAGNIAAALLFFLILMPGGPVDARAGQDTSHENPAISNERRSAESLDRVIQEVVKEREFAWRMPREKAEKENEESGMIASFFEWLGDELGKIGKMFGKFFRTVNKWLDELLPKPNPVNPSFGDKWMPSVRTLLYALLSVLAVLLAMLLWKILEKRKASPEEAAATEIAPDKPDLADEEVQADALQTDEWLALAGDLAAEGSLRLALRAVYLGTLAFLAEHQMIAVARHKSNREYELELRRRAHDLTEAVALFSGGVTLFDSVWYGKREVTEDDLKQFSGDYKRIRTVVEQ